MWSPISVFANVTVANGRQGRPSQTSFHSGGGSKAAIIEDEGAVIARVVLALRGNVSAIVSGTVDLAVLKPRFPVAENEIDIAFDVAIGEVLASGRAGLAFAGAATFAADVQRILIAQQPHIAKGRAIPCYGQCQRLRALRQLRVTRVEVVRECKIFGAKTIGLDIDGSRVEGAARIALLRRA